MTDRRRKQPCIARLRETGAAATTRIGAQAAGAISTCTRSNFPKLRWMPWRDMSVPIPAQATRVCCALGNAA
jgi:hypothetical protein